MSLYIKDESGNKVWKKILKELESNRSNWEESRNGKTKYINQVSMVITNPRKRIVTSRFPPISIAFALAEVIWILKGSNNSQVINLFNPKLSQFCGESETYHGAYGYRLVKNKGNQIHQAYETLKNNDSSRQVVLSIWDATLDLPLPNGKTRNKDIPCNIISLLKVNKGKLYWTQIMRSNDIMRGTPYNLIQFTVLHELFANWLNLELGEYMLVVSNIHQYFTDRCTFSDKHGLDKEVLIDKTTYRETMTSVDNIYIHMEKLAKLSTISSQELNLFLNLNTKSDFLNDCIASMVCYLAFKNDILDLVVISLHKIKDSLIRGCLKDWIDYQRKL